MNIEQLHLANEWLEEVSMIMLFGGAGVSTESGLPDYRSQDGQYSRMEQINEDPKKIMYRRHIMQHPEKFFNRTSKLSFKIALA